VCLTECNLPGLIDHCERYGRFGFAFPKKVIFRLGGRPCLYVAGEDHEAARKAFADLQPNLFGLFNIYTPPKPGQKPQDYTHEREWRLFRDLEFRDLAPAFLLCPEGYYRACQSQIRSRLDSTDSIPLIPIDVLNRWGA